MEIPATLAATSGLVRQDIALSVIRQSAEQDQRLAQIIDEAARAAPVSQSRGTSVNVSA